MYQSSDATLRGDHIQKCFVEDTLNQLALWPPESNYSFKEAINQTDGFRFDDNLPLLSLENATTLDIGKFFETFRTTDSPSCLETPAELWPGQFE